MRLSQQELNKLAAAGNKAAIGALDKLKAELAASPKAKPAVKRSSNHQESLCGHLAAQLKQIGAPEFRYSEHPNGEYQFHPVRKWRLDFYFPEYQLAIEVEGGVQGHRRHKVTGSDGVERIAQSRHLTPQGFEEDALKYFAAELAGISVIRVTSAMVKDDRAISMAIRMLESRGWAFKESQLIAAYRDIIGV